MRRAIGGAAQGRECALYLVKFFAGRAWWQIPVVHRWQKGHAGAPLNGTESARRVWGVIPAQARDLEFLRRRFSVFNGPWAREFRQPDGEKAAGDDGSPTPASFEAVAADEDVDSSPQPGDVTEADEAEDPARNP